MTRWIAIAAGAASLAATASANAQTYIIDEPYAVAPPPVFELAPPLATYAPAPVYVAPPAVYAPRRVYVEPNYYAPRPSRRVIITNRYAAPAYTAPVGGFVEADW